MQVKRMNLPFHRPASWMATLQIRDLHDPLHQMMQQACGGDPRERRRQALADLQALAIEAGKPVFHPSPEELIRQDRER